jgi:hypothetical protein
MIAEKVKPLGVKSIDSYITSQFYTIAIDHGDQHRKTIMGGLQEDNIFHRGSSCGMKTIQLTDVEIPCIHRQH